MKLTEIIEMLGRFGFEEIYVRRALVRGDSVHNAFEGMKTALQLRWGEMCQELSVERQKTLRPVYDRLMSIKMTARQTPADDRAEAKSKIDGIFEEMKRSMQQQREQNLREVFDLTAEYARRQEETDKRKAAKKKED